MAVRVEVDLQDVRTVKVTPVSVELGPVLLHGSKGDLEWIRLEVAEAFGLIVPEEFGLIVPEEQAEKEAATAATVAS